MKKIVCTLLILVLLVSLAPAAYAAENGDDGRMQIVSCPEMGFATLCSPGYTWTYDEDEGVAIYTEYEGSIPYVLVYCGEDLIVDAGDLVREQFTPYMKKKYGKDLVSFREEDEYMLGGRTMSAGIYTYKLKGYLIDCVRAYENVNGHTVAYTAKYIQGKGDATRKALEQAVQYYRPFPEYYSGDFPARWRYLTLESREGDTIYVFDDVFVTVPGDWAGKLSIKVNENSISFYQSQSRWLWNTREGFEGGLLFSLGFSETGDYRNLPSYDELGRSADGNYFLIYPTDYQAYDKVKSARAEYDAMWAEIGYVHDNSFCFLPDAA